MQFSVGNYVLEIVVDKMGGFLFRLMERGYYLGINQDGTAIAARDWGHENMYFPSLNPLSKIKDAVRHWLLRINQELSEKSTQFIEEFLSNPDNLKIPTTEPAPPLPPALPPMPDSNLN
jgi:hypothetical protein